MTDQEELVPDRVGSSPQAPTSHDVAVLAGVSQSTVSYVLSGKRSISPETRRKVEAAIAQLTYEPHAGARALRGRKTNVIALVVHLDQTVDAADTIPYIETIVDEARSRNHDVVLITADEGPDGLRRLAKRSICDGFVLMDIRLDDDRLDEAARLGLPVVLLGLPDDTRGLNAVDFDTRRAGELLVEHLVDTGHEHLVVVGSPSPEENRFGFARRFREGAEQRARLRDVPLRLVHPLDDTWNGLVQSADELFRDARGRLGLIARTPRMAEWLLRLCEVRGLRPGEDVSVVALCAEATAESFTPALTSVSSMPREVSRLATQVLFDLLTDDHVGGQVRILQPAAVVRRASSADFRASERSSTTPAPAAG